MFWKTLSVLCVMIAFVSCNDDEWRQVEIAQGPVRGRKDPQGGLYTFYNIPYATVPSGTNRFKAPLPPPVWQEPFEAVDRGIICLQEIILGANLNATGMQEDCLVANIFVPDTDEKDLAVMVYVHGGAFELGFGNMRVPKTFVKEKKIIVVTFNYRLGVHGFLCLGTEDVPGNAGMKDQVALLRWVKKNIASFGGNPDAVTITGCSAGSISAGLISLSKSTEGLFNRVILESGCGVASMSVQLDPIENAKIYAKMINFSDTDNFQALEHFYKNTELTSLFKRTYFDIKDASLIFAPCIERETNEEVFLDNSPFNIVKEGKFIKIPILIGFSNMEGLLYINQFETWKNAMNEKFMDFIPGDLQFQNDEDKEQLSMKVKKFYFGDKSVGEETVLAYVAYLGDIFFAYPSVRSAKLRVGAGQDQVYLYEYSYVDDSTPLVPYTNVRGATHCSVTNVLFDRNDEKNNDNSTLPEELKTMKNIVSDIWYNFAVHGKPVPEGSLLPTWPVTGPDGGPHMDLTLPLELQGVLLEERVRFWDDIYQEYYRHPIPPSLPSSSSSLSLSSFSIAVCFVLYQHLI